MPKSIAASTSMRGAGGLQPMMSMTRRAPPKSIISRCFFRYASSAIGSSSASPFGCTFSRIAAMMLSTVVFTLTVS